MLNTLISQNLAISYCFSNICEKRLSDPCFLLLVTEAMFFDGSKIPTSVLYNIPLETFIPNLVPISQVMSEEKIFERKKNIKKSQKTSKRATPTCLNRLKRKFDNI